MTVSINGSSGIVFNDASTQNTSPFTGGFAMRNRIINGRFDVWQRSVGPVTGSGYQTADRWLFPASFATQQVANDRDTSIPYALQITADGSGYGLLVQRIEDVRTLSNGPATVSFWAKSPSTGTFRFTIEQNFGSGGSATVTILDNATQFNITSANTWQFFTVTVTMPSVSGKTIGSSSYVNFGIGANSGIANRVMTYSEVQLEKGSTATSFDYRPYGTELALCQRYFYNLVAAAASGSSTTKVEFYYQHPTPMRTAPTLTVVGTIRIEDPTVGAYSQSSGTSTLEQASYLGMKPGFGNFTGLTSTRPYYVATTAANITASPPTNLCQVSAEL
jgi:hypothetical protein